MVRGWYVHLHGILCKDRFGEWDKDHMSLRLDAHLIPEDPYLSLAFPPRSLQGKLMISQGLPWWHSHLTIQLFGHMPPWMAKYGVMRAFYFSFSSWFGFLLQLYMYNSQRHIVCTESVLFACKPKTIWKFQQPLSPFSQSMEVFTHVSTSGLLYIFAQEILPVVGILTILAVSELL